MVFLWSLGESHNPASFFWVEYHPLVDVNKSLASDGHPVFCKHLLQDYMDFVLMEVPTDTRDP